MPKINYLQNLVEQISEETLRKIIEDYAHEDKNFEAFLIEHSGAKIDTGKTYLNYREDLEKILKKCTTRRGFVKVTRLQKAGVESFRNLLLSHFKNENFVASLWMSLALLEIIHQAILMNTRYRWAHKPFKVFEKMFHETRDIFDSSYKLYEPDRKQRPEIFKTLLRCWWREREKSYEQHYFDIELLFEYIKRDEDLMALQYCLQELLPKARELDKKGRKGFWQELVKKTHENSYEALLKTIEVKITKRLNVWE